MKKNSINKIKIISLLFFIVIATVLISHFRAHFYSQKSLEEIANMALHYEISKLTSCHEVKLLNKSLSEGYREVALFEWICLNKEKDEYLITVTIESDGYVDVNRIQLDKDEIERLTSPK